MNWKFLSETENVSFKMLDSKTKRNYNLEVSKTLIKKGIKDSFENSS